MELVPPTVAASAMELCGFPKKSLELSRKVDMGDPCNFWQPHRNCDDSSIIVDFVVADWANVSESQAVTVGKERWEQHS